MSHAILLANYLQFIGLCVLLIVINIFIWHGEHVHVSLSVHILLGSEYVKMSILNNKDTF